jgi:hypothetical protein
MNAEKLDIVAVTQSTAKNLYELMLQLASHIDTLQKENAELRQRITEFESAKK